MTSGRSSDLFSGEAWSDLFSSSAKANSTWPTALSGIFVLEVSAANVRVDEMEQIHVLDTVGGQDDGNDDLNAKVRSNGYILSVIAEIRLAPSKEEAM